jgi:hypothetical protein
VAAKDGSQETAVTLVGLVLGLLIAPLVEGDLGLIWFLFAVFTAGHLLANYWAVRGLVMDTLNRQRLAIVVGHYLDSADRREVLSPAQASTRERALWFSCLERNLTPIGMGTPLAPLLPLLSPWQKLSLPRLARYPYLLCLRNPTTALLLLDSAIIAAAAAATSSTATNSTTPPAGDRGDGGVAECVIEAAACPSIEVLLQQGADHTVMIEAYAAALLARHTLAEMLNNRSSCGPLLTFGRLAAAVQSERSRLLPALIAALSPRGWHVRRSLLGPGPWRYLHRTGHLAETTAADREAETISPH